ncbi:hypothetical protein SAMN05216245_102145 [Succiniclasticum ruminis DSM 9236]|uniref:Uncharacterized protein n=1 Tax=Succiniclasticum ruminis DSM 9236 TaxID=1123323 RepID=A0A1I1YCR8_9FIRM|nr:hypothetical protein SAMN05216245_102145 [Succiniclasticum ruminis DSM 9236]
MNLSLRERRHSELYLLLSAAMKSAINGLRTGNVRRETISLPDDTPLLEKLEEGRG